MRIGIDIMGGDFAPGAAIQGSILAAGAAPKLEIVFIGDESEIKDYAQKSALDISSFEIVHSDQRVEMGDHPLKSFTKKPNSSMFLGQKMLKRGDIDGFCSAGNTGAMLVGAMQIITPIPGVIRPAISAIIPNVEGKHSVLLDVGLNPDARPDVLYQYGKLGSLYAQFVVGVKDPRVALMNIGEEEEKGNLVVKNTFQLMKDTEEFNFIGNLEANALFVKSMADVLVCDGFVGNVILKEAEAFYRLVSLQKLSDGYFEMFNFENYGGTPVLGINAPMLIGHGVSNDKAIKSMILQTSKLVESGLTGKIIESFNTRV